MDSSIHILSAQRNVESEQANTLTKGCRGHGRKPYLFSTVHAPVWFDTSGGFRLLQSQLKSWQEVFLFRKLSRDTVSRTYGAETCSARLRKVRWQAVATLSRKRALKSPSQEKENDYPLRGGLRDGGECLMLQRQPHGLAEKRLAPTATRGHHSEDNGFLFLSHFISKGCCTFPWGVPLFSGLSSSFSCFCLIGVLF